MYTDWFKSAAMALVAGAGVAALAEPRIRPISGGSIDRHLQGRHRDARPGDRLRLAELVDDQRPVLAPHRLRVGTTKLKPRRSPTARPSRPTGKTYTFKLQSEGQVQQRPRVTAEDVKYSIDRVGQPEDAEPGRRLLPLHRRTGQDGRRHGDDHFRHRAVDDPDTIKFDLSASPTRPSCNVLAINFSLRVPKEEVEKEGADFGKHPVGSGAFKLDEWVARPEARVLAQSPTIGSRTCPTSTVSPSRSARSRWSRCCGCRRARSTSPGDGIPPAKFIEVKNRPDVEGHDRRGRPARDRAMSP